jgi:hypothetical protein
VRVVIEGHHLPGRRAQGHPDVHVGLRVRDDVVGIVPGDADTATWECEVRVGPGKDGGVDFFGPAVRGARGDRHLALRWLATVDPHQDAFRGAKLKLERIDPSVVAAADQPGMALVASIHLTDDRGGARCATVAPPALAWSVREV